MQTQTVCDSRSTITFESVLGKIVIFIFENLRYIAKFFLSSTFVKSFRLFSLTNGIKYLEVTSMCCNMPYLESYNITCKHRYKQVGYKLPCHAFIKSLGFICKPRLQALYWFNGVMVPTVKTFLNYH